MSALLDESYDGAHGFGCEVFALGAFAESDVCAAPTGNAALDPTHSLYFLFSAGLSDQGLANTPCRRLRWSVSARLPQQPTPGPWLL